MVEGRNRIQEDGPPRGPGAPGTLLLTLSVGAVLLALPRLLPAVLPSPNQAALRLLLEVLAILGLLGGVLLYGRRLLQAQVRAQEAATQRSRILSELFWLQESFLDPEEDSPLPLGVVHDVLREVSGATVSCLRVLQDGPGEAPEVLFDAAPNLDWEGLEEVLAEIQESGQRVTWSRSGSTGPAIPQLEFREELSSFRGFPLSCGGRTVGAVGLGLTSGEFPAGPGEDLELLLQTLGMLVRAQTLEQQRQRFLARRNMLEDAVEFLDESVAVTDLEGRYLYVNPGMERLSGYRTEELLGQNARILKSGRQPPEFYRELWETIRSGQSWSRRMVNRRKDGSLWTEAATISPVQVDGATVHYVKVARCVDAEEALEQKLRQHQKLEAMGTLSGGIAHEFNNVLGMILGYVELARDEISREDPIRSDLDKVLEATDRGANLVRQILAFSRQVEGDPQPLEVQGVVKETLKMLRSSLPSRVELHVVLRADAAMAVVDPVQVRQLVVNLVTNAAQAIGEDSGTIRTGLRRMEDEEGRGWLEFVVQDDGCGIPEDLLPRVFDPFFTTRAQAEGGGLGLSVVHGIVEACRGTIEMRSRVGEGTEVVVRIPVHVEVEATAPPSRLSQQFSGRVLAVDDERLLLDAVRRTLEGLGFEVDAYEDSEAALERLGEGVPYELLVTDLTMPRVSGLDLARRFKEVRPGGRAVLVTGFGGDAALQRGGGEGVIDEVLFKPLRRARLVECLRELLADPTPESESVSESVPESEPGAS